jgi:hypothetical protein
MNPAARSLYWFGLYLCVLGPGLVLAPALLLAPFGIAPPQEAWVRVAGVLALLIGCYYLLAARHEFMPLVRASVTARVAVLGVFVLLVLWVSAPPALMLFGAIDAVAAAWTAWLLRRTPLRASSA